MTSPKSTIGEEIGLALAGHASIESAALYGSVARGDVEPYSDIDLLVVCCGNAKEHLYPELVGALSEKFRNLSISLYSPTELAFMKRVGSLFLLHLRNESILLFDRTGILTNILKEFEPKPSYESDFKKSLELLAPMKSAIRDSPNQLHRLAQVYALFRIFGVYLLAERGIFEFSKKKMTATLAAEGKLGKADIDRLSSLRVLNANFFTGGEVSRAEDHESRGIPLLRSSLAALGSVVGRSLKLSEKPFSEAVAEFDSACSSAPSTLGYGMRTWFLLLMYDGLNLFARRDNVQPLSSFTEPELLRFVDLQHPAPVQAAAQQGLTYIRNYHTKYVLSPARRMSSRDAAYILQGLVSAA